MPPRPRRLRPGRNSPGRHSALQSVCTSEVPASSSIAANWLICEDGFGVPLQYMFVPASGRTMKVFEGNGRGEGGEQGQRGRRLLGALKTLGRPLVFRCRRPNVCP